MPGRPARAGHQPVRLGERRAGLRDERRQHPVRRAHPLRGEPDLLGLYEGVALTERDGWWAAGSLPDRITIFRRPTLAICETTEEVVEEVAITVVHEIAHHFGIDDDRLHELGWG